MNRLSPYLIFSLVVIVLSSCRPMNKNQFPGKDKIAQAETGKLVPINYADKNYSGLQSSTIDTITNDGWKIRYLVKDDSTKFRDIYIECSKGKYRGLFYGARLLEYRRYFIPGYIGETDSHIYFRHGCATDCSAILTFSKDSVCQFNDVENVVDYNIKLGQILCVAESTYENDESLFELALVDLKRDRFHKIIYEKAVCMNVYKPACIDTVIFSDNQVTITTTLADQKTHMKDIKETRRIKL